MRISARSEIQTWTSSPRKTSMKHLTCQNSLRKPLIVLRRAAFASRLCFLVFAIDAALSITGQPADQRCMTYALHSPDHQVARSPDVVIFAFAEFCRAFILFRYVHARRVRTEFFRRPRQG